MSKIIYPFSRFHSAKRAYNLLEKIYDLDSKRNLVITKNMIGLDLDAYNGKYVSTVDIRPAMVGYKVGSYAFTKITGKATACKKKRKQVLRRFKRVDATRISRKNLLKIRAKRVAKARTIARANARRR